MSAVRARETILRDVIADEDEGTVVYEAQLADRVLARVRTIVPVRLIDVSMPRLRAHVGGDAQLAEWQELHNVRGAGEPGRPQ